MQANDPSDELSVDIKADPPRIVYKMTVFFWLTAEAEKQNSKTNKHNLFSRFIEDKKTRTLEIDLSAGRFDGHNIFELGNFELVDYNQWSGRPLYQIRSRPKMRNGQQLGDQLLTTEPPLWDISTINVATGKRIILIRSHCDKDKLFPILNRINILLDYTRSICKPWADLIHEDERIPIDELREQIADNPPRFRFTPLEQRQSPKSEDWIWREDMKHLSEPQKKNDHPSEKSSNPADLGLSNRTILLMISIPISIFLLIIVLGSL